MTAIGYHPRREGRGIEKCEEGAGGGGGGGGHLSSSCIDDFSPPWGYHLRHLRSNAMGILALNTNTVIITCDASECRYPKINTVIRTYVSSEGRH